MAQWLVIFLLPFAAWSGWWVAMHKEARQLRRDHSRAAYFEGLSYLLNDQTDKAVDVFMTMSELDQQTIDNQLALGSLFRKRGELDRALHLHQQLAKHAHVDERQQRNIQFELGEDYRAAGMFAQSQAIFETLFAQRSGRRVVSVLIDIYEHTGQWLAAKDMAECWQDSGYGDQSVRLAHYDCELAAQAWQAGDADKAQIHLETALSRDAQCARANRMLGEYAVAESRYVQAIHALKSIMHQDVRQLPEILPILSVAYQAINRETEYVDWLQTLAKRFPKARLQTTIADELKALGRSGQAKALLADAVMQTYDPLLVWSCMQHGVSLEAHSTAIIQALKPQTIYQCHDCGFRQQNMRWHCPACYSWNSFAAILELNRVQR